jgi:hypothetical protein
MTQTNRTLKSIVLVLTLLCGFAVAQQLPFEAFEKAVNKERGGFAGDKSKLSAIFNAERVRLGDSFESELWKYVDKDADKHYWTALFITARSYLQGNEPMQGLANRIRERALVLLVDMNDKKSLGRRYSMLRDMAIAAKQLSLDAKAVEYRSRADNILENYKDLGAYIGGLSDYKRCIYANLQTAITQCVEDGPPKETIISAGVLNGRATRMPKPAYPDDVRRRSIGGRVVIKVVSDVNGNIASAEAVSGPAELHQVSIEAALGAKLSPTKLSGQLTKVSGTFIYNFVP